MLDKSPICQLPSSAHLLGWRQPRLAWALLAVAGVLGMGLYWQGLYGGFFFDDAANILHSERLRLTEISLGALKEAWNSGISGPAGRPIAQISFALNHYFSGQDPFAFKATNLALHLAAGVLVFLVARRLSRTPALAVIAAAIWLLHPIHLTSVLYVVQRMTSLAALFLLAGFLLHIIARERSGGGRIVLLALAWGLLWPLSVLSKETGALFPLFVLAWELIIRRNEIGHLDRFARLLSVGVGIALVAGAAYALSPSGAWLWSGYQMRGFSLLERSLTEGRVLWLYLGLLAFPRLEALGLYHDDIPLSTDLFTPGTTLPAWLGVICLAWLAWRTRNRMPLVSFGIAWFLVGHSLESTVLPLEIAHEHRNYVPSLGPALVLAWGATTLMAKPGWQRTLGLAATGMFIGYAMLVTGLRSHLYGDEIRRTQIESQHHPHSARTHYEAGRAIVAGISITDAQSPAYFFAHSHYVRAGELDPNLGYPWLGLIHLDCQVGRPVEADWVNRLTTRLSGATFGPGDRNLLYGIKEMAIGGSLCLMRPDIEALFIAALSNPTVPPHVRATIHSWLADYLALEAHDLSAAEIELTKALALVPTNASSQLKLAQVLALQGQYPRVRELVGKLQDIELPRTERETLRLLSACLERPSDTQCLRLKRP